jgi:hypothetical protein
VITVEDAHFEMRKRRGCGNERVDLQRTLDKRSCSECLWVQPLYASLEIVEPFDFFLWLCSAFVSLSMIQQLSSELPFLWEPSP